MEKKTEARRPTAHFGTLTVCASLENMIVVLRRCVSFRLKSFDPEFIVVLWSSTSMVAHTRAGTTQKSTDQPTMNISTQCVWRSIAFILRSPYIFLRTGHGSPCYGYVSCLLPNSLSLSLVPAVRNATQHNNNLWRSNPSWMNGQEGHTIDYGS